MTLPLEYNKISMGDVRTELNKSSGPISLNDDDVRILFQVSRTSGTIISLHNGHGKSNIMPPVVTKPPLLVDPLTLITQTSVTVTWKAYQSLVIDGQVDHYRVQVYSVPDNVLRWDSFDLPQSATTANPIGLVASADHLVINYRVDVMAKNISATKTVSLDLLTLENIPLLPSKPVATVISKTQLQIGSASTYATTYYIYKDGASIPITTSSMPYTDTVGVYTDHTYTVKGHSTGGDGPISVSSNPVRSLPDAPLAVVFTPYSSTNTTLTIDWTLSTSPVVNYYKLVVVNFGTTTEVYRKNDVSNTTTSITISTNLAATSKYTATLETVNESSIFYNIPVSIAEDVWTKTNAVVGTPVVTKLTDQTLGQSQLQVEWNSVIGATSYKLVRTKVISGVAQTPVTFTVAPTGTSTLTFIDGDPATSASTLSSYSYYRYNVISVNAGGDSALSTISADVRTLPGPPVAVTALAVTLPNITNTTAKATWVDDTGQVNSYTAILKQGATTIDTKANIAPGTQTVTFGSPTALTQDTAYSVTVTTYNDNTPPATTAPVAFRTKLNQPSSAPLVAINSDTVLGRSHLTVTFAAISGATSYKLVRFRISDSVEYVISPVVYTGTTTLTCDDSGLGSYEQYKYQLIAVNDGGDSVRSGYSNIERTLPGPANASTLTVTIGTIAATTTAVSWAWSGSSGQVSSYVVILSDTDGEVYRKDNGTSLSITLGQTPLAALTVNHAYSVVIKVVNANTDTSNAFTTAKGFVTTTAKPNAPSVDTAASTTQLVVNWTTNSATTYDLTRYNLTTSTAGVSLTNKTTPFTDTGLLAYNEYQYTVTSNNSASTPVGVTSDRSPTGVRTLPNNPVAVSGITVTNKVAGAADTTAKVNWTNTDWTSSNGVVTKYDVSVKSGGGQEYGNATVSGSSTFLDVTVPCGETFNIVIKSYNIVTYAASTGVNQFTSPPVKPSAPYLDTGVTPNPTQTRISLKWTAVSTATSYTLAPFKSDGTALPTTTGIGSTIVDWTAVQNTSYYFKISAINPGGPSVVSDNSSPNILTLADKAGVPGTPTVTPSGTDRLTVSWTAPVGGTVPDSYKVTRYFNGTPTSLGTQASGFVDTNSGNGLSANTSYSYTVQSHTTGGDSLESTAGSGTTWMVAPGAIVWAATTFTGVTTTSTTINWTAPTSGGAVTKYVARTSERDTQSPYDPILITSGDLAPNATSFKFDNLQPWYDHDFRVMAYNTNPTSTDSTTVSNHTLPGVPNKPSKPTTSSVLSNSITISCDVSSPNTAPLTYVMYRNGVAAGNAIKNGTATSTSTITYTDTTVSENTAYVYYVQTRNENDFSLMSDGSVSVTTLTADTTPNPTSFVFTSKTAQARDTYIKSDEILITGMSNSYSIPVYTSILSGGATTSTIVSLYASSVSGAASTTWQPDVTSAAPYYATTTADGKLYVKIMIPSSTAYSTSTSATLHVGTGSASFTVTTLALILVPSGVTVAFSNPAATTATVTVSASGGSAVDSYDIKNYTNSSYTTLASPQFTFTQSGATFSVTGLTQNTSYYVKGFASNGGGTASSTGNTLTTNDITPDSVSLTLNSGYLSSPSPSTLTKASGTVSGLSFEVPVTVSWSVSGFTSPELRATSPVLITGIPMLPSSYIIHTSSTGTISFEFSATTSSTFSGINTLSFTVGTVTNNTAFSITNKAAPPPSVGTLSVTKVVGAFGVQLTASSTSATHYYYVSYSSALQLPSGSPKFTPPDTSGIGVWKTTDYYLSNATQYLGLRDNGSVTIPNDSVYVVAVNFVSGVTSPPAAGGLTSVFSWSALDLGIITMVPSTANYASVVTESVYQSVPVPFDATKVTIEACGGGGGGGGTDSNGGGNGAGAPTLTSRHSLISGTTSLRVLIGGGGLDGKSGSVATGGAGGSGGTSPYISYVGGSGGGKGPGGTSGSGGGGGGATVVSSIPSGTMMIIAGGGGGGGGGSDGKTGGNAVACTGVTIGLISGAIDLTNATNGVTPTSDGGGGGGGGAPYCKANQPTFQGTGGQGGKDNNTNAGAGLSGGLFIGNTGIGGFTSVTAAPADFVTNTSLDVPGKGGKRGTGTTDTAMAWYGTGGKVNITFIK